MGFASTAKLIAILRAASLLLFQGLQIPAPMGLVNDFADVIQPAAAERMERIAEDVRTKSRGEMAIVTLPDIGTRDVQEVALQIGRQWKLGKLGDPGDPTRNAGAVILLVPKETSRDGRGRCFIATGYGAEGFIRDADAGTICREATPAFAAKDYSTGLELVTLRVAERFAQEFNFSLDTTLAAPQLAEPQADYPTGTSRGIPPFVWFILFIVILSMLSGRRRGRRRGCGVVLKKVMGKVHWGLSVLASRWRNRFRYLLAAPVVHRNWWAMPLPKLGVSVVLELRNGLRYLVRSGKTDLAVVNEAAILNPYLAPGYLTVPEDAVVVDVGANIGDFTVQVARICPRGRVIAVEPIHEHVRMIKVQTLLNGIHNVVCVRAALGNREGEIEIHGKGGHSSAYWGSGDTEKVRLTTLPQLMRETGIGQIALLKLDCEGAEWDILPAAEQVLPQIWQICMEFHCAGGWTPEKLASWLRQRGFEVRHTTGSWNGLLWASRTNHQCRQ